MLDYRGVTKRDTRSLDYSSYGGEASQVLNNAPCV